MARLSILVPVLAAFVLAGCANYQGPIKANRTVCMVAGAIVGGVVSGAVRNNNGGDGKDNRGAAAAGAAGGALAGYLLCADSEPAMPPSARASAEPSSGTAPLTVELRSTASSGVVSYEWDFGDGSSGSGQTASHTYQDPGEYRPTVTVTDGSGQSASASAAVQVSAIAAPAPTPARRIVLRGVTFAFDSAELTPEAQVTLEVAVEALSDSSSTRIRVGGHTDATGPDAYNQGLSERRAQSVAAYLKDSGISTSRLSVEGYGESQPVADNGTRDGRAQNRRVELSVLD